MVTIQDLYERFKLELDADRIGPDTPFTHWRLYLRKTMTAVCRQKFASFGDNAEFRAGAYAIACSKIHIGSRVVIRPQSMLFADPRPDGATIDIEDDVLVGSGVHIYTGNHAFEDTTTPIINQGHQQSLAVVVRRGSWIGANVTILPGVEVGENAVVGAGSVVTKTVRPYTIVAGNPAREIRSLR